MEDVIEEEMMALEAIFYDSYSKINDNSFRIRIDSDVEEDAPPAFFLEFQLPKGYPDEIPKFDLSNINNSKYPEAVKAAILEGLHEQVRSIFWLGLSWHVISRYRIFAQKVVLLM